MSQGVCHKHLNKKKVTLECVGNLLCNVWKFHLSIEKPVANELRQETGGGSSGREGVGGEEFWERVGPQETDKPDR